MRKVKGLKEEGILHSWRYRVLLHKAYFGKGQAIISEFKLHYLILPAALLGTEAGLIGITTFCIASYLMGRLWFSRMRGVSLTEIEAEVGNQFNKFQQEMRATYKKQ